MDYFDAIMEILDIAGRIKLPHYRLDVVTIARREFAQRGFCDNKVIAPIEGTLRDCLRKWSMEQRREIWFSTETVNASSQDCEDYDESSIDMELEGELMYHIIGELSPQRERSVSGRSDNADER